MSSSPRKHRLDLTWPIVICILISVISTTAYLNFKHTDYSATKVVNALDIDNGDLEIDWTHYPTRTVTLDGTYRITQSGTYHLTGTLADGSITIDTGVDSKVRLILDQVSIASSNGPVIYCSAGDELVVELVGNNTIIDGETYDNYDSDVTGAIYSKADLSFTGEGTLNIIANYADAIVGKDDVKFNSGSYDITATDDGIRGKDSVYIIGGDFTIDAGADAIKSTNDIDVGKGFVLVEQGNFNLTATAKGIKATRDVVLQGGNYSISSTDDSIHSDHYIGISGGTYNINAGDDAIHANSELIIDGGNINIAKAYEGLEAQVITINNGGIRLATTDDGINAGGGADESSTNRPGANQFEGDENCILTINGGNLYVNASGDGIDSNGWLYFNGGEVVVDGPTNNGNGALDASMGIIMNGGKVLAIGASGMAESLGNTSSVNSINVYFSEIYPAGTVISIQDASGNEVFSHTSAKSFSHLAAGSTAFTLGSTYSIYINGELSESFTISGIVTNVGQNSTRQTGPGNPMQTRQNHQ